MAAPLTPAQALLSNLEGLRGLCEWWPSAPHQQHASLALSIANGAAALLILHCLESEALRRSLCSLARSGSAFEAATRNSYRPRYKLRFEEAVAEFMALPSS